MSKYALVSLMLVCCVSLNAGMVVVGYLPFWPTLKLNAIDPTVVTHILYAYIYPDTNGNLYYATKSDLEQLKNYKQEHPNIKILASIGGEAQNFHLLSNSNNMNNLIRDCNILINDFNLDGIDVDWEYPTPSEKQIYTDLIRTLKQSIPSGKIVMSTAPAKYQFFGGFDTAAMNQYLDYVGVMTYDFFSSNWGSTTNHNAALYGSGPYTTDGSIKEWKKIGLNGNKILVGLPFYGRQWRLTTADHGVGASSSKVKDDIIAYNNYNSSGWIKEYDSLAQVPYAWNGSNWISYDDEMSLKNKITYVCRDGYPGVFIWDFSQDTSNKTLTKAIEAQISSSDCNPVTPPPTTTTTSATTSGPTTQTTTLTTQGPQTTTTETGQCINDVNAICGNDHSSLKAYPPDCNKFVNCPSRLTQDCPSELVFNPNVEACDWDFNYECTSC